MMKRLLKLSLSLVIVLSVFTAAAPAQTVASEGCFPAALSSSGPVSTILWCQIVEYTGAAPLTSSGDTGLIHVNRSFTAGSLHVEYDPWYAAMDSTFQLEVITGSQNLVFQPFMISYLGSAVAADIPLGGTFSIPVGSSIRLRHWTWITHPCGLVDNCGMHAVMTFQ